MNGESHSLALRLLYSINSSPQYILARSYRKFPVSLVHRRQTPGFHYASTLSLQETATPIPPPEPQDLYATASLKACLDTICCSSPELIQDNSRDFSVYVLDPLESQSAPAPVNISANSSSTVPRDSGHTRHSNAQSSCQQPRGVAVGLGLMSWALLADERESVCVTGTVLNFGTTHEALEVIFALRETTPMQKATLPAALRSWGLPPPPSKRSQVHASKSHQSSKHPSSKSNQSTSHLPSFTHASGHSKPHSASSHATTQDTNVVYFKRHPTPPPQALSPGTTLSSPSHTTHSERILHSSTVYIGPPKRRVGRPGGDGGSKSKCKKSTLAHTLMDGDLPPPQADSLSGQPPATNSSLMSILTALSTSGQNAALLSALSAVDSNSLSSSPPNTDAPNPALVDALKHLLSIACLPEKVNKPAQSSQSSPRLIFKPEKPPTEDDIVVLDKENVNPSAFRRKVDKEDAKLKATDTSRPKPLENKENATSSPTPFAIATRKRRLSDFMDELEREQAHRKNVRGRAEAFGKRRSEPASTASSQRHALNSHYRDARAWPLTSPPRPSNSGLGPAKCPSFPVTSSSPVRRHKPYVVPAWARTTTATKPRFSKEFEEHLQATAAESENKKGSAGKKEGKRSKHNQVSGQRATLVIPQTSGMQASGISARKPVMASSPPRLPIFASELSLPPSSPPPPSSPLVMPPRLDPPRTPRGKGQPQSPSTPWGVSSSLFTPTPKSLKNGQFHRLARSRSPPCSPVGVALGKKKLSPTGKVVVEREIGEGGSEDDSPCALSQELNDGLEESSFLSSSLPIASSDGEGDVESFEDDEEEDDRSASDQNSGFDQEFVMQHWSGLPPSSPPPPTSPLLSPPCNDGSSDELPSISLGDPVAPYSDGSFVTKNPLDLDGIFPAGVPSPTSLDDLSAFLSDCESSGDVLSDNPQDEAMADLAVVQNGLVDFDFSEFWKSMRPLVDGGAGQDGGSSTFGGSEVGLEAWSGVNSGQGEEVDHLKLAAEVQALFSGCLA